MTNEVKEMYEKTEKLPGLDLFVNLNFERMSEEDQNSYILAANEYMNKLKSIVSNIQDQEETAVRTQRLQVFQVPRMRTAAPRAEREGTHQNYLQEVRQTVHGQDLN